MINFSITGSSCGIKLSYYDLMLRFLWNLCKLQTSTNCGSNLTNLLIHLSLVTQFLNFRDENNTFSVLSLVIRIPLVPLQIASLSLACHVNVFICALLTFFPAPSLQRLRPPYRKMRPPLKNCAPLPCALLTYTGPEKKLVGK